MKIKLVMLIFLFITLALLIMIMHPIVYQFASTSNVEKKSSDVKIIAHRGANLTAPENTLSAFSKAIELGVDMIEIDVHLTKDKQLIVIHDELLNRTTNGTGKVSNYTLNELKVLDAGSWFSKEYAREQLPSLNEVLKLIDGKATCLIEIKWGEEKPYDGIEEKIVDNIILNNATKWTIVQSFESSYLKKIHQLNPSIKLGKLLLGSWQLPLPFYYDHKFHWGKYTPAEYIDWVNFYFKRATPLFIKHLHSKGVKVGVFTPNLKSDLVKQLNMGVDAIITNNSELAIEIIRKQ